MDIRHGKSRSFLDSQYKCTAIKNMSHRKRGSSIAQQNQAACKQEDTDRWNKMTAMPAWVELKAPTKASFVYCQKQAGSLHALSIFALNFYFWFLGDPNCMAIQQLILRARSLQREEFSLYFPRAFKYSEIFLTVLIAAEETLREYRLGGTRTWTQTTTQNKSYHFDGFIMGFYSISWSNHSQCLDHWCGGTWVSFSPQGIENGAGSWILFVGISIHLTVGCYCYSVGNFPKELCTSCRMIL